MITLKPLYLLSTLALLGAATPAWAQSRDPAAATELFSQGREAVVKGDYATACPKFSESQRLDPKVGTLLNLADCEERVGRLADAYSAWQQAVNLAQATQDARQEIARDHLNKLSPKVPRLTVKLVQGEGISLRLFRDGIEITPALLNTPLPVNPGKHIVVLRVEGIPARETEITLAEGDTKTVTIHPQQEAAPAPVSSGATRTVEQQPASTGSGRRTLGYVLGGVGVAGVAVGVVTGLMLMSKRSTIDEHCFAGDKCDPAGMDAASAGKTLVPINTVAWVVGVVGLGAGTYLLVTGSSSPASNTPTGMTVGLRGAF